MAITPTINDEIERLIFTRSVNFLEETRKKFD